MAGDGAVSGEGMNANRGLSEKAPSMSQVATGSLVRQLGSLFEGGSVAGLSDRQLIDRFITRRDAAGEAAFAALVARHGPMVLDVCRQLLGDRHHAEDASQAVFFVLARKAGSIRDPDLLGNWLYGVALRSARKTKVRLARKRKIDKCGTIYGPGLNSTVPADQAAIDLEQAEALHDEIERLPRAFRLPVISCYLEGLTVHEAAQQLRCSHGTVRSRMARARAKLRDRLSRRGVVLPASALAAVLNSTRASASVPSSVCDITARAAIHFAAGHNAAPLATALAREVLRSMLHHKLKSLALTALLLGAVATVAGSGSLALSMMEEPMKNLTGHGSRIEPDNEDRPRPVTTIYPAAPGQMTVTGRVLDPDGKPAARVPVDIIGRSRAPELDRDVLRAPYEVMGSGATENDGRFRIEAARASSATFFEVYAQAGGSGPGSGFEWSELNPDADGPAAEIRLRAEQVIWGRLVDVSGQPAAGVEVELHDLSYGKGHFIGIPWSGPFQGAKAWPKPITTDSQGRFAFTGVGRGSITLLVRDSRFAQQKLNVQTDGKDAPAEVTLALQPAAIIEGRVLTADTGQPISNAVIAVDSVDKRGASFTSKFRADDEGRFQVNPHPGESFRVRAHPREGQPYLVGQEEFAWIKGTVKKEIVIKLPPGVLIQGKVTEEGTGRPVAGAIVKSLRRSRRFETVVLSKDDGSFQLVEAPGKGYLLVLGPTLNYVPEEIGGGTLYASGQPGGMRFCAHGIMPYEAMAGGRPHELTVTLRPGKTLHGRVVGPAGETVLDAVILSRQQIDSTNLVWLDHNLIHARDGRFVLPGFDAKKATTVYFLDADHEWGAAVEFSGKQAGEEQTIHLQPCGQARARFLDPTGKPVANFQVWPYFQLIMTPGPNPAFYLESGEELAADAAYLPNVDPNHYQGLQRTVTDGEGRITFPDLIPGALYRISDCSTRNDLNKGTPIRKDFTVKPGETLDLGEILIEKPPIRPV